MMKEIDPLSATSWATALGEARLAAFAADRAPGPSPVDVLVDGPAASFLFSSATESPGLLSEPAPLNWAWSAGLRHAVVVSAAAGVVARRWDRPREDRRFPLPRDAREMGEVLEALISAPGPRGREVVPALVAAFRSLRAGMHPYGAESVDVVRVFNRLLILLEAEDGEEQLRGLRSLGDLGNLEGVDLGRFGAVACDDTTARLLQASPAGLLNCHLLLRHAAGQLYQEAHFELERSTSPQRTLWGTLEASPAAGRQKRDARFTPTPLARSLTEQALDGLLDSGRITILDPACGSGVFLQEAFHVLESGGYQGQVEVVGFDTSAVSVEIARFCVGRAARNAEAAGITTSVRIEHRDALAADASWGEPDIILMNPPFVSYRDLSVEEREAARMILGDTAKGQFDKAMPFLTRGVKSLSPGGVLASILPAALLDSSHGEDWRASLTADAPLRAVGRFKGYGFFPGAMVEPAVVILEKRDAERPPPSRLTVVLAEEGEGDAALRALRRCEPWEIIDGDGYRVSRTEGGAASSSRGWVPLSVNGERVLETLASTPTVGELFRVHQGALTGFNTALTIDAKDLDRLVAEGDRRDFFRPVAGTKSISRGRLTAEQFVFYPYDSEGKLLLADEEQLRHHLPTFHATHLSPHKDRLSKRQGKEDQWWTLTRTRNWQHEPNPKLVTAYFGDAGSFAVDIGGEYVVVHGYGWIADGVTLPSAPSGEDEDAAVGFFDTDLPFAYAAVLNSEFFSFLMSCFCPRVSGGQFNLSKRFIDRVPLPDLGADSVPGEVSQNLANIGRRSSRGDMIDLERLAHLTARAYNVSPEVWESILEDG